MLTTRQTQQQSSQRIASALQEASLYPHAHAMVLDASAQKSRPGLVSAKARQKRILPSPLSLLSTSSSPSDSIHLLSSSSPLSLSLSLTSHTHTP